jgi:hypothetical protein
MRPALPVLIVANSEVPEPSDLGLDGQPVIMAGESHALALIEERPFGGLVVIVGGAGPLRRSRELVDAFRRCQPVGHVAILSHETTATLMTHVAHVDDRIELFYAPWDGDAIRCHLRLPPPRRLAAHGG